MFRNPVDYFRLCVIGEKVENEDKIEESFSVDLKNCSCYDCLGRKVQLNILGLQEVREIVLRNMERIGNNDSFEYKTNNVIFECISKYEGGTKNYQQKLWKR